MHELVELEQQGWRSLATEGDAARRFYASVLRADAVMLLPGGYESKGGRPSWRLSDRSRGHRFRSRMPKSSSLQVTRPRSFTRRPRSATGANPTLR